MQARTPITSTLHHLIRDCASHILVANRFTGKADPDPGSMTLLKGDDLRPPCERFDCAGSVKCADGRTWSPVSLIIERDPSGHARASLRIETSDGQRTVTRHISATVMIDACVHPLHRGGVH